MKSGAADVPVQVQGGRGLVVEREGVENYQGVCAMSRVRRMVRACRSVRNVPRLAVGQGGRVGMKQAAREKSRRTAR